MAQTKTWHSASTKRRYYLMAYKGTGNLQNIIDHKRDVEVIRECAEIIASKLYLVIDGIRLRALASYGMTASEYYDAFLKEAAE